MKKVLAWVFTVCGLLSVFAYIGVLIHRIIAINSGDGIIGGADAPTFLFLIQESPIALAVIGIASLILGVVLFCRKSKCN